ncbi:cartilage matrix protein-like [Montipora foliosa]|uniref:cartilage matrix protein-like n=1 Tax=Montipora foliosa TaxID=591990 RepID=UPI0035F219AA
MTFLFVSIIILQTWHTQGQNKFATCKREWTKIGCFKDRVKPSRPLPEMLLNDRDRSSIYHEPGYELNYNKWNQSQHSLACRCAEKALQKGYRVFGLQFYGECWSGPFAEFNYARDGKSDKCIMNFEAPTACVKDEPKECVGQATTNYIYMLTKSSQSPDVDGGFSEWLDWRECSKTCGDGTKSRERECTNPKPQGKGKPCEGDNEEVTQCNMQECFKDCDKKMDVAILVDSSSSVRRGNFEVVKTFIEKLVEEMPISSRMTHVALIRYNHKAYKEWDFLSSKAQYFPALKKAISELKYRPGGTRTDRAMSMASETLFKPEGGDRGNVHNVLLVLTDGKTSPKSKPYPEVRKPLKDKGVKIIAVGVGPFVDNNELTNIAMGNSTNIHHVKKFDDLSKRIDDIISKICFERKQPDMDKWFHTY